MYQSSDRQKRTIQWRQNKIQCIAKQNTVRAVGVGTAPRNRPSIARSKEEVCSPDHAQSAPVRTAQAMVISFASTPSYPFRRRGSEGGLWAIQFEIHSSVMRDNMAYLRAMVCKRPRTQLAGSTLIRTTLDATRSAQPGPPLGTFPARLV